MFTKLEMFTETDQIIRISVDYDNPSGVVIEVFESDGKTVSPRLYLSPKESAQLSKAIESVESFRTA